ncbi:MAG: MFS transporter [Rhizobiales bacterium]|nr:MFS transporter [Hyphomicrobiales bacterium]MBN8984553.1 MFS transporter [Hyphomicrobiales bacterium]
MSWPRDLIAGPGRAVTVLSFTQILGWGILIYPPVLMMPLIAAERGWSLAFCMSGLSVALATSGLLSPTSCGLIDRYGGNRVMSLGALAGMAGMIGLALADHWQAYLLCWLLIGAAMSSTLYDPAFTTLTRIFGATARRQITFVTFAGGFASTVGWPATHVLLAQFGWRGTYIVFAIVLGLVIAPLHAFALPRAVPNTPLPAQASATPAAKAFLSPHGWPFVLLAAAFACHAFLLSGVTSNLLAMLERGGIDAATVVTLGALFGPAQVMARLGDFTFASKTSPLWVARAAVICMVIAFASLAVTGISVVVAGLFCILFGAANGVMTIARGAVPLAMFGPTGYGRVIGRIARPALLLQASAPFAVAAAAERLSDRTVLELGAVGALAALSCLLALRLPSAPSRR